MSTPNPPLVAEFARLRFFEIFGLVFLAGGFAAPGLAFLWLKSTAAT